MLAQANEEGEACSTSSSVAANGFCRPSGAGGTSACRGAGHCGAAAGDEGEDSVDVDDGSDFDVIPSSNQQPSHANGNGARPSVKSTLFVVQNGPTFHAQSL